MQPTALDADADDDPALSRRIIAGAPATDGAADARSSRCGRAAHWANSRTE